MPVLPSAVVKVPSIEMVCAFARFLEPPWALMYWSMILLGSCARAGAAEKVAARARKAAIDRRVRIGSSIETHRLGKSFVRRLEIGDWTKSRSGVFERIDIAKLGRSRAAPSHDLQRGALFVAESDDGVDAGCAPRREERCGGGDCD